MLLELARVLRERKRTAELDVLRDMQLDVRKRARAGRVLQARDRREHIPARVRLERVPDIR